MNDTDIETRLREQLPALADFAIDASEPVPRLTEIAPTPNGRHARVRTWAVVAAGAVLVVAVALAATLTRGSEPGAPSRGAATSPTLAGEPAGPAVHTLTIVASNFHYDAIRYEVPAGITTLRLQSEDGRHTLVFDQPQFAYVQLAAPDGVTSTKVDFVAGHTYGVFCSLPGHQQAGEVAVISVVSPDSYVHSVATTSTTVPAR